MSYIIHNLWTVGLPTIFIFSFDTDNIDYSCHLMNFFQCVRTFDDGYIEEACKHWLHSHFHHLSK